MPSFLVIHIFAPATDMNKCISVKPHGTPGFLNHIKHQSVGKPIIPAHAQLRRQPERCGITTIPSPGTHVPIPPLSLLTPTPPPPFFPAPLVPRHFHFSKSPCLFPIDLCPFCSSSLPLSNFLPSHLHNMSSISLLKSLCYISFLTLPPSVPPPFFSSLPACLPACLPA